MFRTRAPSARRIIVPLACAVFVVAATGCGKHGPKLVPVGGRVMVGTKPVTNGYVILYPDKARGNTSLEEPRGEIDPRGNYNILTGARAGAAPGWYRVAVTAAAGYDPKNPYFTEWLIPQKYIDPKTSKLTIEVVESPGPGAYDFKLDPK
jgi:hypothetical protein